MIRLGSFIAGLALVGAAAGVVWGDERDVLCRPGYAASVRPAVSISQYLKRQLCEQQGISADDCRFAYRLDHIIPLELGGEPIAASNLQLQTVAAAHAKDLHENEAHREYCEGKIELPEAQAKASR
jgi:hypothetical protein